APVLCSLFRQSTRREPFQAHLEKSPGRRRANIHLSEGGGKLEWMNGLRPSSFVPCHLWLTKIFPPSEFRLPPLITYSLPSLLAMIAVTRPAIFVSKMTADSEPSFFSSRCTSAGSSG